MMNEFLTHALNGVFKTASPAERERLYTAVKAAIRAGDMEIAHLTLLELVRVDAENPEYWLLLAWTSPDPQSAEIFFTRLVVRYPNHPTAKGKVPWSGKAWGQAEPDGDQVSEVDAVAAAEIASITREEVGTPPEASSAQADATAPKVAPDAQGRVAHSGEHQPLAGTKPQPISAAAGQGMKKEEGSVTPAEPSQNDDAQQKKNDHAAPAVWGGIPVSEREARWLTGVIPGVDQATEEAEARQAGSPGMDRGGQEPAAGKSEAAPEAWETRIPGEWGASAWTETARADAEQGPTAAAPEAWKTSIPSEWSARARAAALTDAEQNRDVQAGEMSAASSQPGSLSAGLLDKLRQLNFTTVLVLYMLGITLAEVLTSFVNPQVGLVVHGVLLVLILLHSAVRAGNKEQRFLLALGMAPLIRLLSLSMPLLNFDFMYWYMIIGIPLLVAAWVVYRLSGYKATQVGLAWGELLPAQIVIGLSGIGLGFIEYLILKPQPLAESFTLGDIWLPALILLVFTGFLEELIFRGLMQRASVNTLKKYGPLYISILFAVLHIGYKSWVDLVFVFLVGFAFSVVVERTRSLIGVTLAHGLTNISLFLIFPFLIGAQLSLPDILTTQLEPIIGPAIWSRSLDLTPRPMRTPLPTATYTPVLATPMDMQDSVVLPGVVTTLIPTSTQTSTPTQTVSIAPTRTYTATSRVVNTATLTRAPPNTATATLSTSSTPTATPLPSPTATETLVPTDVLPEEPTPIPTDSLPDEPIISP